MSSYESILPTGPVSTEEALALFDRLEPVDIPFMLGAWNGADFPTGHEMEGLLQTYGWYGKTFLDADHVHPLVFNGLGGSRYPVNPLLMPIGVAGKIPAVLHTVAGKLFPLARPLVSTRQSAARLRLTAYRGKVSAAMIYDRQPIQDVFRKVDANTVLGIMDLKGMSRPYFFILRRDRAV